MTFSFYLNILFSGEKVGFLVCFSLEHYCMAHAHELLCQDSEYNCPEVSKATTGDRTSWINKQAFVRRVSHTIKYLFSACIASSFLSFGSSCKLKY